MKLKIKLLFPVFLLLILSFTSCKTGPVKVGLLMHSLSSERWERDKELITKDLKDQGAEVLFRVCNNDQALQNKQARELIDQGVKVLIVVSADQNQSAKIVQMAHENDVKVIAYDRLMRNCDLDFYVPTNSVRVGEEQARYMTSVYPKGKYALIIGNKHDNNALLLFIGQMNVLESKVESGDVQIVYSEYTEDWSADEGYRAAKELLDQTDDQVDVIIAGADGLAYGVQKALKEVGLLGKVGLVSQDADLKILRSIVKGNQTATIYKPLEKMAQRAADLSIELATGKEIKKDYTTESNGKRLVPSYKLEPVLVNKDNMSSTVIASGYHTSEEIFQ